jgi:mono/diheme cytochrome c family protein
MKTTLFFALLALAACRGNRADEPPVHLQQNMDFQEKLEAQERSDFFADGRANRKPPDGTVAVGFLKDDDHLHRGRNLDGTLADALPPSIKLDEKLLSRGQERYEIYCQPCHGSTGRGDGPATRRGGGFPPGVAPGNLHMKRLQPEPLGYFFHVITNGKGKMRSYKAQIPVEDRWAIVAWVRTLQVSSSAKQSDLPATPPSPPSPPPAAGQGKATP